MSSTFFWFFYIFQKKRFCSFYTYDVWISGTESFFITHTYFTIVFTVTVFPYLSFETSFRAVFFFCFFILITLLFLFVYGWYTQLCLFSGTPRIGNNCLATWCSSAYSCTSWCNSSAWRTVDAGPSFAAFYIYRLNLSVSQNVFFFMTGITDAYA